LSTRFASEATRVTVSECSDALAWDAYVNRDAGATIYHQYRWKAVIEKSFGHRGHYLACERGGAITGVLPLVEMKSWLFGKFLISVPYFNYGGVLADDELSREALIEKASALAKTLGCRHIELRQGARISLNLPEVSAKVAMIVPLPSDKAQYSKALSSRLRNKIRHAEKHGLECRWGGREVLNDFYSVFAVNMRDLGTPVYPKSWFENVLESMGDQARILSVWDGKTPVAATVIFQFRDTVELPWIASTPEARKHYSTALLYWTAITWAIEQGFRRVDLGRCTKDGGTYQFKQQWACEEIPLHWYYWLAPGIPIPHIRPDNPKYRLAINIWKKLPLSVANTFGPKIVRFIP